MKIGCFWLQWVLVTFGCFLVSLYWIEIDTKPNVTALECIIGGGAIAALQGIILQQRLAIAPQWLLISVACWGLIGVSHLGAIGWVVPKTLVLEFRLIFGLVQGAVAGALLGVGQWFILRQQVKRASLWILASTASWAIALGIGWTISGVLRRATHLFLSEVVGLAVTWFIVATITGIALIWLLDEAVNMLPNSRRESH